MTTVVAVVPAVVFSEVALALSVNAGTPEAAEFTSATSEAEVLWLASPS